MNRLIALLLLTMAFCRTTSAQHYDFQNTRLKDHERIDLLMRQLTLDEKISLLSTNLGVPRLGIPSLNCYEGLHGIVLGDLPISTPTLPPPSHRLTDWGRPGIVRRYGGWVSRWQRRHATISSGISPERDWSSMHLMPTLHVTLAGDVRRRAMVRMPSSRRSCRWRW